MVTVVALMAIVKELDLHNAVLSGLYPDYVGSDGSLVPGRLFRPNGRPLNGTPFKMRVITNGEVPFGMKALIVGYFTLFFGLFAAGFAYLAQFWLDGVLKLKPSAWAWGCFGASGVVVQVADRLPSWLNHAYGLSKSADGVTGAQSLCTALEEGGEMMIAVFALLTIYLSWRELRRRSGARAKGAPSKRVLFWGRFDHGYSKTRVNIAMFRALGWEVDFFDVKLSPRFGDVEAFFRGLGRRGKFDLVFVPVCRQRDIAAACRWAHRRGIKVLFDPMISAWDKKVLEQKKWKAEEPRAKRLLEWERKLMAMPDYIVWDTSCHVDFAAEYLGVPREKMCPLFTGTDERVFRPVEAEKSADGDGIFKVLYHGAYLPLHGTETIVEAARLARNLPIRWDFLGWGAYKAATEAKAAGLENVRFLDKVPYEEVAKVICAHDIVLGVFGTTAKAARVIGNKVYECLACARPTINEFCTGYPSSAKDCKAIKFIPAGDAEALVRAVEEYRADWADKESYFAAAREFFERELSMKVVRRQLSEVLERMGV
jgi:glycosyltransferase involved in cell wall biosynthesis